jgi:hypothetical protein
MSLDPPLDAIPFDVPLLPRVSDFDVSPADLLLLPAEPTSASPPSPLPVEQADGDRAVLPAKRAASPPREELQPPRRGRSEPEAALSSVAPSPVVIPDTLDAYLDEDARRARRSQQQRDSERRRRAAQSTALAELRALLQMPDDRHGEVMAAAVSHIIRLQARVDALKSGRAPALPDPRGVLNFSDIFQASTAPQLLLSMRTFAVLDANRAATALVAVPRSVVLSARAHPRAGAILQSMMVPPCETFVASRRGVVHRVRILHEDVSRPDAEDVVVLFTAVLLDELPREQSTPLLASHTLSYPELRMGVLVPARLSEDVAA